jgi:isoquinoline 1-oxidoreductase subunit beta
VIGNDAVRRYDSPAKTNGTHPFTIDVKLPGMLTAVIIHPPKFGATVASFDAAAAKALPGVVDVVETPRGIAVVGEHMWAALKGREAVTVQWDETNAETRGTPEIMAHYRELLAGPPQAVALKEGDSAAGLQSAAQVIEGAYEFPYLAHAALEPLNAVARMNEDGTLEVWGGHQMPDLYQYISSQIAGLTPDKVKLHVMRTGGGFGRRGVMDADVIAEVVEVAKALNWAHPVKVQWTRENDMKGGRYRPAMVHAMKAALDGEGKVIGWQNHIVGQSIALGTISEGALVKDGVDFASVEGASNMPYAIPNISVGVTNAQAGVPVLFWRAVGPRTPAMPSRHSWTKSPTRPARIRLSCGWSFWKTIPVTARRWRSLPRKPDGTSRPLTAASAGFRWWRASALSLLRLPKSACHRPTKSRSRGSFAPWIAAWPSIWTR